MIAVTAFRNETVAVMGLGRSGLVAAQALQLGGARVLAWDDAPERRAAAAEAGVPLSDLATAEFAAVRALVLSPGIPHRHPAPHRAAARAHDAGIDIIGDIELLLRSCPDARYVGITGTNGKSTTTALIGHLLRQAGRRVAVGGNLGIPALALEALGNDGIYVLELSSYQLELTPSLGCEVAVLLNITPDHLDRHGGIEGYIAAKERIFAGQRPEQCAVIGVDDEHGRRIATALATRGRRVVPISAERAVSGGVYAAEGWLVDNMDGAARRIIELGGLARLPGRHNWQNAAAAFAAARCLGVDPGHAAAGLESFQGLAHRQELVAIIDGVRYVNDSKATNADAAAKALACYERVYWIAGGLAKAGGIASLAPYFSRIRRAYLIGAAAESFAATLRGAAPVSLCGTLEKAVAAASEAAAGERGATVLLSPACASFDQFANFEARGDRFRALVQALPGVRS